MADIILGIESSCDDTSAAVIRNGWLLSNVIASQQVHKDYGGVVPELASRAHEQNIVPVVSQALEKAGVKASDLTAIAFTRGPGLLGSLLVGTSFAKALSLSLDIPMVMVNHLQGHILANFIREPGKPVREPSFPYLCLLVSGGNSQIVKVSGPLEYEILGQTIDDAAGEAIDKCSKVMGLGYPGGPIIDRLARQGNPKAYQFSEPHIPGLQAPYSGLGLQLQRHQDFPSLFRTGPAERRSGVHGKEQGRHLRQLPEDLDRHPDGQTHQGVQADRNPRDHDRRRRLRQQRTPRPD